MISKSIVHITAVLLIASASFVSAQRIETYGKCTTQNGDRGSCINLHNCTSLLNLLKKKPLREEDRLFLQRSQCGSERGNVLVCCRDDTKAQLLQVNPRGFLPPMTPITLKGNFTTYGDCITPNNERSFCTRLENCAHIYNMLKKKPLRDEDRDFLVRSQCGSDKGNILVCCSSGLLPKPGVCGNSLSNRIIGGVVAKIDEFPWMALILYDKGSEMGHHCGGSLINDRYVLTAAHCLTRVPETWTPVGVRLGEWDTSTDTDCTVDAFDNKDCSDDHVDIPIELNIIHHGYVNASRNQLNDIALIRLSRSVMPYTDFIRPICLPIRENLKDISLDGIAMDIAGWGFTETGRKSTLKMKAVVRGVSLQSCKRMYGSGRYNIHLGNTQVCAGGEIGIDSCKGDSGGPLTALDTANQFYYVAGIISFGPNTCGLHGWPGVYTKVSHYVDWIQQNLQP